MKQITGDLCQGRIRYSFELPAPVPDIYLEMEYRKNVFFFFQEALNNVIRHSQASHLTIRIWIEGDWLHVTITDDGKGFDTNTVIESQGLVSMKEREKNLKGRLDIESSPEKGTQIYLRAPLPKKKSWIHGITGWPWTT